MPTQGEQPPASPTSLSQFLRSLIITIQQPSQLFRWIGFFLAAWIAWVILLSGVAANPPPILSWLRQIVWPTAFVLGLVMTGVTYYRSLKRGTEINLKTVMDGGLITGGLGAFVLLLWVISLMLNPSGVTEELITPDPTSLFLQRQNEVAKLIAPLGLSERQQQDVEKVLVAEGYITRVELEKMGLTQTQIQSLEAALQDMGYITREDAISIFRAESTAVAALQTATAMVINKTTTAAAPQCYITAEFASINIRSSPTVALDNNIIGFLFKGQRLRAVAHNGGDIGEDLWWVVEYSMGDEIIEGWVLSSVTDEINIEACLALPQARGT